MAKKQMMKKEMDCVSPSNDEKWKAEGDFRSLKDAEAIKADPERLKKALAIGKQEYKAIESIMDLKEYANKMAMEEEDGE
jgi:hypothetical protein